MTMLVIESGYRNQSLKDSITNAFTMLVIESDYRTLSPTESINNDFIIDYLLKKIDN